MKATGKTLAAPAKSHLLVTAEVPNALVKYPLLNTQFSEMHVLSLRPGCPCPFRGAVERRHGVVGAPPISDPFPKSPCASFSPRRMTPDIRTRFIRHVMRVAAAVIVFFKLPFFLHFCSQNAESRNENASMRRHCQQRGQLPTSLATAASAGTSQPLPQVDNSSTSSSLSSLSLP